MTQPTLYQLESDQYIKSDKPMTFAEIEAAWKDGGHDEWIGIEIPVIEHGCCVIEFLNYEIIATDINEVKA